MNSLFDPADNNEIVTRIHRLDPAAQPQWGKMTVAQMLAHIQQPLRVGFGELKLKRGFVGFLFGGATKRKIISPSGGFTPNMPTDKSFVITDERNFEEEKKKLVVLVQRFAETGPEGLTKEAHPFFGDLTSQEWDILQWKHLDHHLRQFGA